VINSIILGYLYMYRIKNILVVLAITTLFSQCYHAGDSSGRRSSPKHNKKGAEKIRDKFRGVMVAAALGDALGRVTEFIKSIRAIYERYPDGVTSFDSFLASDWYSLPSFYRKNKIAPYTDDTRMAMLVLQGLLSGLPANNEIVLRQPVDCCEYSRSSGHQYYFGLGSAIYNIAERFVKDMDAKDHDGDCIGWNAMFRAPGTNTLKYVNILSDRLFRASAASAKQLQVSPANGHTGGCGSVMRAHPFGLIFLRNPAIAAAWAAEHSSLTHGDAIAVGACAVFAEAIALIVRGTEDDALIPNLIQTAERYSTQLAEKIRKVRNYAQKTERVRGGVPVFNKEHDAIFTMFPGWAADDAIVAALYCYLVADDIISGIYLGVHSPGDSDSIASIAGALLGAKYGYRSIQFKDLGRLEDHDYLLKLADKAYRIGAEAHWTVEICE
jgi:ADP-ribosylglycohydrolase